MSAPAVEAVGVERRFRGGRGVGPVSLRVETGETLALMGHNGAGKTTLLRVLATADRPLRGEVRWNGARSPRAARHSLGLALDRVDEEPVLTGRQAAHFWCRRWVRDRGRARTLVDVALRRFGLADVADEPVAAYSFGMRRRLGLVEALAHEPALAFLDEPTAGLDPEGVTTLRDELNRRSGAALTTVVASNDSGFVEAACARVAFLSAGELAGCAAPQTLLGEAGSARVAELTLGRPPDAAALSRVAGVESVTLVEGGVRVRFADPAALPAVVALADGPGGALRTLRVRRPDLGDRFAELTGRTLEGSG